MLKTFKEYLKESESFATTSNVNGMGATTFPTDTEVGSGDIPFQLNLYSQDTILNLIDFIKRLKNYNFDKEKTNI